MSIIVGPLTRTSTNCVTRIMVIVDSNHTRRNEKKNADYSEGVVFVPLLKACAKTKDLKRGIQLHSHILKRGLLESNAYISGTLVSMYAKCGALMRAREFHDELSIRNVVSWTALISAYAQHKQCEEALNCFNRMTCECIFPNVVTFINILNACGNIGAIEKGKQHHQEMMTMALLGSNIMLSNALLDMYVKCGALEKARQVLDELPFRDMISWNTLIAGYSHLRYGEEALECFVCMQNEGFSPNRITYACLLKACGSMGDLDRGKGIHDQVKAQRLLGKDILLGNASLDMYVKCGTLSRAQEVLDELPFRDVVSWNTVIAGYAQQGQLQEALSCYKSMSHEGVSPDPVTFICILKACSIAEGFDEGKLIHDEIVRQGLIVKHSELGHALVDMYARSATPAEARIIFYELETRDVLSWSLLIAGYVQQGYGQEAVECLDQMQMEGVSPNVNTFVHILKACGSTGAIEKGRQIHDEMSGKGYLTGNIVLSNAVVAMYAKCNELDKAREVFDEFSSQRDLVSWNTLIAGYSKQGQDIEAIDCYEQLTREGLSPDAITFACILKSCGNIGDIDKGKHIHDEILHLGLLEKDVENNMVLATALVDMYARCGAFMKAQELLLELPVCSVISWSALIQGYAQWGQGKEALNCFARMVQQDGIDPNPVTLLSLLNCCSHCGLTEEGQMHFASMRERYGIIPSIEHYICMIDLYCRVGDFDKAVAMIEKMPSPDHLPVWITLMSACKKWGNIELGRYALDQIVQLDGNLLTSVCGFLYMHLPGTSLPFLRMTYMSNNANASDRP